MFEIPGSRKGYYQWDLNQRLYIQDNSCNEVHFCSEKHPESLTCWVREEEGKRYVQVPNILLQSCLPITVFAYVKGADEAYTKRSLCIEVTERPKPDDYVYTETEVKTWESAVEYALQEAKESGAFRGEKGDKGDKGDTGEQGPRGEKGDKGDGVLTEEEKLAFLICCCEEGVRINLKDAGERPLVGLRIFGKTAQEGAASLDAPAEYISVGNSGSIAVTVSGDAEPQNMTISTFGGLPGIPVTSGGNYIDASGQRWVCDEIDLSRGVYIQRVSKWALTPDMSVGAVDVLGKCSRSRIGNYEEAGIGGSPALCTHLMMTWSYDLDEPHFYVDGNVWLFLPVRCGVTGEEVKTWLIENNLTILYQLATPVEAPLSEEDLAAYAALHTYMPDTVIHNDAGAWMQVSYAADTKTYIDNKFAELAAAIVNNT